MGHNSNPTKHRSIKSIDVVIVYVLCPSVDISDHNRVDTREAQMSAFWEYDGNGNTPKFEDMVCRQVCIVCKNYPERVGSHSGSSTRVIEIGEATYGVLVCDECAGSMWNGARRGRARDDYSECTAEMWRQSNKDEYTELLEQQLRGVLREEKRAREFLGRVHYARVCKRQYGQWDDRHSGTQNAGQCEDRQYSQWEDRPCGLWVDWQYGQWEDRQYGHWEDWHHGQWEDWHYGHWEGRPAECDVARMFSSMQI